MLRQFRKSGADFIDGVKRTIAFWDRWRNFILPVFIILLVGLLGLLVLMGQFLFDPNNPIVGNQNKVPWVLGFLLGATFGLHLYGIMKHVIDAAFGGYRAEHMLIELHESERCLTSDHSDNRSRPIPVSNQIRGYQKKHPSCRSGDFSEQSHMSATG